MAPFENKSHAIDILIIQSQLATFAEKRIVLCLKGQGRSHLKKKKLIKLMKNFAIVKRYISELNILVSYLTRISCYFH